MAKASNRQIRLARKQAVWKLDKFLSATDRLEVPRDRPVPPHIKRFLAATDEILAAVARKKKRTGKMATGTDVEAIHSDRSEPSEGALRQLRLALNRKIHHLTWKLSGDDPIRHAAELLLEYLRLVQIGGPLHTACDLEGCNEIVIGERASKRFCSTECQKKFWKYENQPEYWQKKSQNYYNTHLKKGEK